MISRRALLVGCLALASTSIDVQVLEEPEARASGFGSSGFHDDPPRAHSCGPSSCKLRIIAKGDSRTQGQGMTPQQIYAYVGVTSSAFTTADPTFDVSTEYVNLGLSGETEYSVSLDANNTGGPAGNGFDLTALLYFIDSAPADEEVVVSWLLGTNDLAGYEGDGVAGGPGPPPAGNGTAAAAVGYRTASLAYLRSHATHSFRVLCFTEEDRSASFNTGFTQAGYEAQLPLFAAGIHALGPYLCDGVYPLFEDPNYGAPNAAANTVLFQDGVHNTIASMAAIGAAWVPFAVAIGGR